MFTAQGGGVAVGGCAGGHVVAANMNAQFVSIYRKLLKQLSKACLERPHYVQETRLLLSYPLVENQHTVNMLQRVDGDDILDNGLATTSSCASHSSLQNQKNVHLPLLRAWRRKRTKSLACTPENMMYYLQRSPSECWRVDRELLFNQSRQDLYNAIVQQFHSDNRNDSLINTRVSELDNNNLQEDTNKCITSEQQQRETVFDTNNIDKSKYNDNNNNNINELHDQSKKETLPFLAQQLVRYRELVWLNSRLDKVLSDATMRRLDQSLRVFDGPNCKDDFIDDEYFANKEDKSEKNTFSKGNNNDNNYNSSNDKCSSAKEPCVTICVETSESPSETLQTKPIRVSHYAQGKDIYNQIRHDLYDEHSKEEVYSAGALGLQREMFILRHIEDFPAGQRFLSNVGNTSNKNSDNNKNNISSNSNSNNNNNDDKIKELHSLEALEWYVRGNVPSSVTCRNTDVELEVQVRPFDEKYTHKDQAGVGFFATAHRQFIVRFILKPIIPTNYVQVVNSYFARFDFRTGQLTEEVGYLHSRDVRRLLRERDIPFLHETEEDLELESEITNHIADKSSKNKSEEGVDVKCNLCDDVKTHSSSSSTTTTTTTTPNVNKNIEKESMLSAKEYSLDDEILFEKDDSDDYIDLDIGNDDKSSVKANLSSSRNNYDFNTHTCDFTLFFANSSDGANVLKGALYYKVGSNRSLMHEPIRVLPFGHVLLNSESKHNY